MRTQLPKRWTEFLITQPERGMGYQRVDVEFSDGTVRSDCLVFNATEIELPESEAGKGIARLSIHVSKASQSRGSDL